jgi:nicotinate-nucleotide adenylyltransferase
MASSPGDRSSDKIVIDEREILRSGPSFTIDTVKEIEQLYPGATIYLIIGQDQAQAFSSWREHALIVQKTQVVIAARDAVLGATSPKGLSLDKPAVLGDAIYLNCPLMPISATEVRASIDQGLDVSQLVPELVLNYIQQQGLYSNMS